MLTLNLTSQSYNINRFRTSKNTANNTTIRSPNFKRNSSAAASLTPECLHQLQLVQQQMPPMSLSAPPLPLSDQFTPNYALAQRSGGGGSGIGGFSGAPEPLRIIETVIAEDAETNANTPESLTDSTPPAVAAAASSQATTTAMTASATAASSSTSSLSIYTALPQSFSFSPPGTMTTDATTSFMTASASVPTSVSAASSNTSCSNKFTRKRERVCNSNSSSTLSKLANCKAFSK